MVKKKTGLRLPFVPTAVFLLLIGAFVLKFSLFDADRTILGVNETNEASSFESDMSGLDSEIEDVDLGMAEIEKDLGTSSQDLKIVKKESSDRPGVKQMSNDDLYTDEELEMPEIEDEIEDFSSDLEPEDVQIADLLETDAGKNEMIELVKEGSGLRNIREELVEDNGEQLVMIEGVADKKLFGVIPVAISERMTVLPETGEVIAVDRSFWSMLLNFWSR